jgi:hypothetical protein
MTATDQVLDHTATTLYDSKVKNIMSSYFFVRDKNLTDVGTLTLLVKFRVGIEAKLRKKTKGYVPREELRMAASVRHAKISQLIDWVKISWYSFLF